MLANKMPHLLRFCPHCKSTHVESQIGRFIGTQENWSCKKCLYRAHIFPEGTRTDINAFKPSTFKAHPTPAFNSTIGYIILYIVAIGILLRLWKLFAANKIVALLLWALFFATLYIFISAARKPQKTTPRSRTELQKEHILVKRIGIALLGASFLAGTYAELNNPPSH